MIRKTMIFLALMLTVAFTPLMAYQGLSVATTFPSIYTSGQDMITFKLKVHNYNLAPQRVDLSIAKIPVGWDHVFIGGGGEVEAVFAETNDTSDVDLWIKPPPKVKAGIYTVVVRARGNHHTFDLPLTIKTGQKIPHRLSLTSKLPSVRGTPASHFTFKVDLRNNSASEVMINLDARAPDNFQVTFKKEYGSDELSTISLGAGKSETLKVEVAPPQGVAEGKYEVEAIARTSETQTSTKLTMDVQGQPKLSLNGPGGLLSGSAVAGKEKVFNVIVNNFGSAVAKNIKLSADSPSNWKVEFDPKKIDTLNADKTLTVKAMVTPSDEALTGDYNVTFRANSDTGNTSEKFRVTVHTSTLWGIVAILIIAAALVVLVLTVRRFGRR